ncbi:MAG: hypothetical protein A2729_02660 [Candidatus Buchananbacteria bacterium RIFCSPHIGHO2_01_FULL_39_14]|uniref:Cation-transporting P-type ATPase N-terminal domain-containing protein n=1 Tax=Candidatus Buchananbacteria bacterium RIFCSPHIGHO2_01_FULL_39_14 TaxID=1797532 RepID=A0A1G1XSK2_9BACT|nr:MAG: hypothetical protein A2729_02660 [Candidatus Buchananbacteria bacterium RIFCSPHIGHO2_01_FULL_39_14]OGY48907.1 MAG: hypothetical protein A3D39_01310 [Candidatus Buchananbacteria bacterium RIFCSPHIGHO2_02_FULL_39_17]
MTKIFWHHLPINKIYEILATNANGLSVLEAENRLKKNGENKLPEEKKLSVFLTFINQFKSPLVYVLLAAALITLILKDLVDFSIIMLAVLINTWLGFYQENKANQAITFLKKLVDFKARVFRDGHEVEIKAKNLVPGDIISLTAGDKIPADARITTANNFQVVEAALTGESIPSEKNLKNLDQGTALADRENMVYSGTVVVSGKAKAVVCATGIKSELGQITKLVSETKEEKTPLQIQLTQFSHGLTYFVIFVGFFIVMIGRWQGRSIFGFGLAGQESMLNTAVAVAVAAIPEGLLISVTAILAIGMKSILRRKALIRRLIAAETLGSVSIICTDKTGTLTEGKMQVAQIITYDNFLTTEKNIEYSNSGTLKDHELILKIGLLCNDAVITNPSEDLQNWQMIGSPTDAALMMAAVQAGLPYEKTLKQYSRLAEIPFNSEMKYMSSLHRLDDKRQVIYVKGAPEKILARSNQIRINAKKQILTSELRKSLDQKIDKITNHGLRLLAFAYKQIPNNNDLNLNQEILNDLIFVGFVAIKDPLRPEAKETFKLAKQAGIRPIIVTGDHRLTAKAVVSELGLKVSEKNILEGSEIDQLSDEKFLQKIKEIDIYARVEPHHKLRIIHAWQKQGEVVAMTGDGVNDAPALKAADIGIALGSGTDVAKETADLILLDNNFKTIISAVERGRVIFENIKKIVLYLLSDSFAEVILVTGSIMLNLPLPLLPAQIIWINLIDDGFPNLALTFEPGEREVMKDKPRKKSQKILNRQMKFLIFVIGVFTNLILLGLFYLMVKAEIFELNYIRTLIFATLGVDSLLYVFSCRSLRQSIFTKNPFSNPYLILAVFFGFTLQLIAIYHPLLKNIFHTVSLQPNDWLFVFALALIQIVGIELTKHFFIVRKKLI